MNKDLVARCNCIKNKEVSHYSLLTTYQAIIFDLWKNETDQLVNAFSIQNGFLNYF